MSERLVGIPVTRIVRDRLKEMKGWKTWSDFILELLERENMK